MKMFARIFVPLLVSILAIFLATRNIDWKELGHILSGAKAMPIVWGALISLFSFYVRGYRWKVLLKPFQEVKTTVLIRWQIGGLLVNNLLPLRLGEVARAYWAGHKSSISKTSVFATIVVERVLDVVSIALAAVLFLSLLGLNRGETEGRLKIAMIALGLIAALAVVAVLYWKNADKEKLKTKLAGILPHKILDLLHKFASGLVIFKDKRGLAEIIILSPFIWAVDILVLSVISRSLELNLTFLQAGLTVVGLILGVMVPAAPGAAGTYEAGGVAALTLMGFDKTRALSFVLLLHAFQYVFILLLGIPCLALEGFNPKKMLAEMKEDKD